MPNRIIKESICTSDTLAQLTAEEERLFYRLLVQVDDYGRFDGRAAIVLASCFPLLLNEIAVDKIEAWLQRLAEVGLIKFYHVDGRRYLYVTKWSKHQTPPRANKSKYPAPPDGPVMDKEFPDEADVEDLLVETLRASASFNGERISTVDRQLRVKESYLDVVVRTSESSYVIEIKRSRLSNKAIKQLAGYLDLLPGRGILMGCGLSGNFDMEACRERGIAVVVYDDNLNCEVVHDGGFLRAFPRLNVKSRDVTLSVYSRTEKRESRNEKRETTDETRARVREADSVAVRPSVGQSIGLPVDAAEPSPDMAAIARHYGERIGMLGPSIFSDLGDWHDRGMDAEVIMAAIDRTAEARSEGRIRGSPDSYLRGVIRQMYNDGIRTADDLRARGRADPRSPDYDPVAVILERAEEWERQYKEVAGGDS